MSSISVGPVAAGSIANDASIGSSAWSIVSNASTEDGNSASYDAVSGNSQLLKFSAFGLSIPSGATIDGIQVRVKKKRASSGANMHDELLKLTYAGSLIGENKASATRWPSSLAFTTYGGATDKWTLTGPSDLTPAMLNDSSFGFVIQGSIDSNAADDGQVDFGDLQVWYTAAAGGLFTVSSCSGIGCSGPRNFNRLD